MSGHSQIVTAAERPEWGYFAPQVAEIVAHALPADPEPPRESYRPSFLQVTTPDALDIPMLPGETYQEFAARVYYAHITPSCPDFYEA